MIRAFLVIAMLIVTAPLLFMGFCFTLGLVVAICGHH